MSFSPSSPWNWLRYWKEKEKKRWKMTNVFLRTVWEVTHELSGVWKQMMIPHLTQYDKWWHNVRRWNESERAMMFNWLHLWLWQFQVNFFLLSPKSHRDQCGKANTKQSNLSLSIRLEVSALQILCMWQFSNI